MGQMQPTLTSLFPTAHPLLFLLLFGSVCDTQDPDFIEPLSKATNQMKDLIVDSFRAAASKQD